MTPTGGPGIEAIVPTIGASPLLGRCLEALARENARVTLVLPDALALDTLPPTGDATVVRLPGRPGFAAANNAALRRIDAATVPYVALVNDDAIVEPGWSSTLRAALEADHSLAAVQGLVFRLDDPSIVDGWGIGWNRWSQAIQLGHGRPATEAPTASTPIFGVSATAALFRRGALAAVTRRDASGDRSVFDEALFAYYEDVDLAARLRVHGFRALAVPAARALHAGSASGSMLPWSGRALVHGNRLLVLARLLGWRFLPSLPRLVLRDLVDALRLLGRGDPRGAGGVVAGLARAARRLPEFAHGSSPQLDPALLRGGMPS
ncbi:MAG: glycosyltransferase [Acidobacteriota bacterium]